TAIVYAIILIGIRIAGKREIGQMTSFDLVLLLLLSNAVQNAMTGPDTSLLGGIEAALTLFAVNIAVVYAAFRLPNVQRGLAGGCADTKGQAALALLQRDQVIADVTR